MEMHEEQVSGVTALAVKGRLDSTTAPLLGARLESVMAQPGGSVVVDFANVEYVSSAGFRVLLIASKRADESSSRLVLSGLSAKVRHLFDLGGFLDLFSISASREEALKAAS